MTMKYKVKLTVTLNVEATPEGFVDFTKRMANNFNYLEGASSSGFRYESTKEPTLVEVVDSAVSKEV